MMIKKLCFFILFLSFLGWDCHAQNTTSEKTFVNPVYNKDFADPTVIKAADGYYYAYGTNTVLEEKSIRIQVLKSKDLVN